MSILFRPKRAASSDHAPGPNIAKETAVAARMNGNGSMGRADTPDQTKRIAKAVAVMGVQRPPINKPPQTIGARRNSAIRGPASAVCISIPMHEEAKAQRRMSRPKPGQELGNVEKRRCMVSDRAYKGADPVTSTRTGEV